MQGRRSTVILVGVICASFAMLAVPAGASTEPARATEPTYANPVNRGFADTFADPSLLRGKDGWWYSYGTSDPLREGEGTHHRIPIARSHDLVTWSHVGDAFTDLTLPGWAATNASIWAPDVRFVEGQYRMYYVVTETTVTNEPNDNAIGMATAPSPAGPWTDSGGPVVGPRRGGEVGDGNFRWTFDPSVVTDADGGQWLFYGSYYGGVHVTRLSADGKSATGTPTMVAIDNKFEGAYPVHRGGYWYLFASTANCCAGPATGYSVQVGRSRTPDGPYVDREGVPLTASQAGGTPVLAQNGNRWVGAGHNAVVTDLGGQDWMAYHAIDRSDPFLDGTDGINERPMLLDRLDWVDGWPAVRAGAGPSEALTSAPVTAGRYVTDFSAAIPAAFRGADAWTLDQGGLVAYVNDDLFTRLSHVAIFNTRQTEFGKEMPYAGRLAFGGTIVGPPAATTWLRITHHLDPRNGEHELRAWTSRNGTTWVKGGVWTLPATADLRVGLISHGGAGATSAFDYLRVYRDVVP